MNTIWIVLPILTLLMFELGLTLRVEDFRLFYKRPRPVIAGLVGQLLFLPLLAFAIGFIFRLEPLFFVGIVLIACSPGGSSSNIFSMLAKGDVALSVSLTALSSIITLFTIPVIMEFATRFIGNMPGVDIHLPVGSLIVQNILLMLVPILAGVLVQRLSPVAARKIHAVLSKIAFPALIFLAAVFFCAASGDHCRRVREVGVVHHPADSLGDGRRGFACESHASQPPRGTYAGY